MHNYTGQTQILYKTSQTHLSEQNVTRMTQVTQPVSTLM